jgi:hypothetical protein
MSKSARDEEMKKKIDDSINIITISLGALDGALKELNNLILTLNREEQVEARRFILESLKSSVEEARCLFTILNIDDSKDYVW